MKIKNILMAGVVAITSVSLPTLANAETSYATPQELLIEALEVAVSGVESTTYDEALGYVESLITVNGSEVSYDGDVIGYWDSTNSDTLFADSAFTNEVLSNGGTDIWEFDPDILSPMLTDFNNKLIETIVPTTEDWSKIIGKYDVTLGSVTVPANQWMSLSVADAGFLNISKLASVQNLQDFNHLHDCPAIFSWLIYDGELYISSGLSVLCGSFSSLSNTTTVIHNHVAGANTTTMNNISKAEPGVYTWITADVTGESTASLLDVVFSVHTNATCTTTKTETAHATTFSTLRPVTNIAASYTGTLADADAYGIAYYVMKNFNYPHNDSSAVIVDAHNAFFTEEPQSSKQQIGNTILKQRLSKFSSLVEGDTIEVTPIAWTIRGLGGEESDFDTYLGSQDIMAPGEETSIPATADIEALAFKVVLPTSLPIYVDELNQVSVATNATVKNESGAAVIVNSVSIAAKPESGWTLLTSGAPSKARDAKEFTFTTDLAANTVLAVAEERPFHYNAELSPSTEGIEQLDLAEVLVTIDWAEVT